MGALNLTITGVVDGESQAVQTAVENFSVKVKANQAIAAAKTGSLTTRTSVSAGTLTMDAGHGFATADVIDLFWYNADGSFGARRGVTVGTVATNSVPISSGTGDDLPAVSTAITAMKPNVETISVVGDNIVVIEAFSDREGFVVFTDSSDVVLLAIGFRTRTNNAYIWYAGGGATNPFAGDTVAKVKTSHNDSAAAHSPVGMLCYN